MPRHRQPQPGGLPAADDVARPIGKRARADVESPRKDTDLEGFEQQRSEAPPAAPTRRTTRR